MAMILPFLTRSTILKAPAFCGRVQMRVARSRDLASADRRWPNVSVRFSTPEILLQNLASRRLTERLP
jgi:hypothetical protein